MKTISTYYYNEEHLTDYVTEIDFIKQNKQASSVLVQIYSGILELEKL